ncbi:class F sortase [Acetobacteraceae bacterium]|nr:class F sortase [Candidatus Parcubacteria bacterium]
MSEKPLLLSSAKSGVLLKERAPWSLWRTVATCIGIFVILIGAMDVAGRVSKFLSAVDTSNITHTAFAPLGTLDFSAGGDALPQEPLVPTRIHIPALTIDASVQAVGLKSDGKTMAAPSNFTDISWYKPGVQPGAAGNAVFAGHLNSPILARSGVFEHLGDIQIGDTVVVSNAEGRELTYIVSEMNEYTTELAPLTSIFKSRGPSQIVLVTCEGNWDPEKRSFDKRLVVTARLLP